jgi:hypothetical protein
LRIATIILGVAGIATGQPPVGEYELLAKVIPIVLSLVSWPSAGGTPPLKVAVVGGIEFGVKLDRALENRTVGGRSVNLRYLTSSTFLKETQAYDVVFIDKDEKGSLDPILARVQGRPVLTMGYAEGLGQRGVMLNFYFDGDKIRFEANPKRIKDAGLNVNSHLLNMARIVGSES